MSDPSPHDVGRMPSGKLPTTAVTIQDRHGVQLPTTVLGTRGHRALMEKNNSYGFRRAASPTRRSVQRTRNLKHDPRLKLIAKGTSLLMFISFLLLCAGGHSALTWVMGSITLILALCVYVAAALQHRLLHVLEQSHPSAGIEERGSLVAKEDLRCTNF